jgi:hypothetical protein
MSRLEFKAQLKLNEHAVNSVAYKAIEGVLSLEKVTKLERPVVFTEGVVNNAEGKVRLQAGRRQ